MAADPTTVRPASTVGRIRGRLRRWWRTRVLAHRRLLAFLCAAGAVATGVQAASPPAPPSERVLVAARDLPAGTLLSEDDLREAAYSDGTRPPGTASDPVGRTLAAPLGRGEPVTEVRLTTPGLLAGYPGLVAVPVRIPDPGAVALLRVGDRIDVMASDPERAEAAVVARAAPVLSLPREDRGVTGEGVTGGLVVLGVPEHAADDLAVAAVRSFLMVTFSR